MPLDPAMRRLVAALSLTSGPPCGVDGRRAAFRGLMGLTAGTDAPVSVRDLAAPVPLRLYAPDGLGAVLPCLIYLHGGGFVCGDLDTHDALCRAIAVEASCRIVSVGYRLAPEHRFPAALDDAAAAAAYVFAEARALGIDPERVAIGGDSAGATLAAALTLRWAKERPGRIAAQLLLCPILDWAADPASRPARGPGDLFDAGMLQEELRCYLPAGADARDPAISPLRATEWRGLPPAIIHTAEFDPVRGEGALYADRLRTAGVAVRHTCHLGMIHLFFAFGRLVPYARAAVREIGAELCAALA
jgi:acetyl esterase/lipase